MPLISIRRAVLEDADVAVQVLRDSITALCVADHENDPVTLADWLQNKTAASFARWIADADSHLVVAELDGIVCGVGSVHKSGEIRLCYVQPGRQRVGIGAALLAALESQAGVWGLRSLQLNSTVGARAFYEQRGYDSSGEPVPGFGVSLCAPYRKALVP